MARVYRLLIYLCMDYAIVLLSLVLCTLLREIFLFPLLVAAVVAPCVLYSEQTHLPMILNLGLARGQVLAMGLLFLAICSFSRELISLLLLLAAVVFWYVLYLSQRLLPQILNWAALAWLGMLTTPVLLLTGYKEIIFVSLAVGFAIVVVDAALHGLAYIV